MEAAGFDPSDAIEFWDRTNRQDWYVCELAQKGAGSRGYSAGRYSLEETDTHGKPRQTPKIQDQGWHFLETGEVIGTCDGPCDPE